MSVTRSYNPIWSYVDLNGNQLDDTFYYFILQNTLPYLPAIDIYKDQDALINWSTPIQFLANGTLPENIYYTTNSVYRLEIRNGPTQADALIYLVENYVPLNSRSTPTPGTDNTSTLNQITNPQFADVLFPAPLTISTAGTTEIAPGWVIVTTGSGSVVVSQVTYTGDVFTSSDATNASYGISIQNIGFSSVILRQRFNGNGALWTGAGPGDSGPGVALNVTARSLVPTRLTGTIRFSDGIEDTQIISELLTTANQDISRSALLPVSTSTDQPDVAWTEVEFSFLSSTTVFLTSIQLIGQHIVASIPYIQETLERQEDHEFHYYNPLLQYKPIPSLLTAWDFPLNPAQSLGTAVTMNTTAAYIWDQTIGQSVVGNVAVVRNAVTGGIQATTANALEAFYYMQYLTGAQAKKMLDTRLSVNVNAFRTQAGGTVTCRVYLYRGSSAAVFPTLGLTIGGSNPIDAGGVFTKNNTAAQGLNWTEIPRSSLGLATGQLSTVNTGNYATLNDVVDLKFSGWEITNATEISDTDKFCIVVTFQCPTTASVVVVNSVSVVPGDIATRPAPQTIDQVWRESQYYWQSSFPMGVIPAANTGIGTGESYGIQIVTAGSPIPGLFVRFPVAMRATPTIVLLNPAIANNQIRNETSSSDLTSSSAVTGTTAVGFPAQGTAPGGSNSQDRIGVHWTAQARLGIV